MQIFDDGHLTDAKGRKVDFRNSIIVMTSNIGSDLIKRDSALGFALKAEDAGDEEHVYGRMKDKVMDEFKRFFRPEFLNRIDASVVFHPLSKDHIIEIVELMLNIVQNQMQEKNITMEVTQSAKELLATKGYDPNFGARPLRRVIQDEVEDMLSEELLEGKMQAGDTVVIDVKDDKFVINTTEVPALP